MGAGNLFHEILVRVLRSDPREIKILDFGCGAGGTVNELLALGYDAYGCDVGGGWSGDHGAWKHSLPGDTWTDNVRGRLAVIASSPYRLPYPDKSFDVVASTQVFEHAQNKEEAFAEISRVLKADGLGLHFIPAKWRFIEGHIYVPMVSWMWPRIPYWWLKLWAFLGIRNEYQHGMSWREVAAINRDFCRHGIHYWRLSQYRALFRSLFGDYVSFESERLDAGRGRLARLVKATHLGWLACPLRAVFQEAWVGHHNRANTAASASTNGR